VALKLTSQPSGATVLLGDTVLGKTPLEHRLAKSQSEVTFLFKLAGHRPERRTVTPSADAEVKATLAKAGGGGRQAFTAARRSGHQDRPLGMADGPTPGMQRAGC
jgi:hypothetical protein